MNTPSPVEDCAEFTVEHHRDREEWLAVRADSIGASEAAGVLGASKWSSPLSVFASKLGAREDFAPTGVMELGNILEPYVAAKYAEKTGHVLSDPGRFTILRSRKYPFITTTLDRIIETQPREPLELKTALHLDEWQEGPPLQYQVQVQQQLLVTGWASGAIAAMSRTDASFIWYRVERHEVFIASLVEQLQEFWERLRRGEAPPADASKATSDALQILYPEGKGGEVALGPEFVEWDRQRLEAVEVIKAAEAKKREAENHIRQAIGDRTNGRLPTGERYSWNLVERSAHEVKASASRVLRRHAAPKGYLQEMRP